MPVSQGNNPPATAGNIIIINPNLNVNPPYPSSSTSPTSYDQTAYHGTSNRNIEQFDWQKYALSGEGAMVHGAGTYVASDQKLALTMLQ